MDEARELTKLVKDITRGNGAIAVGIATTETLKGGPPSTDLSYVLPKAKSAIVFALPLDQDVIERYLKKEDMAAANIDNRRVNIMADGIALQLSEFLKMKGHNSVPVTTNRVYRTDTPKGPYDTQPPISHRYLAARSGVGHFGLSGNVIMNKYGAATILASVVTEGELVPTEPLPPGENYCDGCRLCMSGCASGLMSPDEGTTVTLGGIDFTYSRRRSYDRCVYVCGGFSGVHKSGKWSTWSPARFPIPEKDEEFMGALMKAVEPYVKRFKVNYGFYNPLMPGYLSEFTCGMCQLICHPDKKVRQGRYKMLANSGVIIQEPDGTLKAVTPKEAEAYLGAMDPQTRLLYEHD
jgi:epoxyqueuosine reductase